VTEPKTPARTLAEVVPGVLRWTVERDERIGGAETDAYAVVDAGGSVLIDPLPLVDAELERLVPVRAICLTAQCHQRSSWRYRERFGAPVHAPEGVRPMEGEPDEHYREGDLLPGDLRVIRTPGPEEIHFSFLLERSPRVLFCSDLLTNYAGRGLEFVPFEYHDDPAQTRRTVEGLLELDFDVLCLDHGAPLTDDPHAAIRALLARTD
jgi:glyoxylase-like metal-dependent hydrolase (beta-lactamase superfamily II)